MMRGFWMNSSVEWSTIFAHTCASDAKRSVDYPTGISWGGYLVPAGGERRPARAGALRIVAMTSFTVGLSALGALVERHQSGDIDLVGVVTDEATNPDAKIGLRKRCWSWISEQERFALMRATMEMALSAGAEVYTGELKTGFFRQLIETWRPDAILCCCLGQLLDAGIINVPALGTYNFHPSDLGNGYGAGYAPHAHAIARQADTECWTVHRMTEVVHRGPIVAVSPSISIRDPDGALPERAMDYYDRMIAAMPSLMADFLHALAKRHALDLRVPVETPSLHQRVAPGFLAALQRPGGAASPASSA
ncbi:formyltransferase family protein [Amorphus sp. MBR-141]